MHALNGNSNPKSSSGLRVITLNMHKGYHPSKLTLPFIAYVKNYVPIMPIYFLFRNFNKKIFDANVALPVGRLTRSLIF